MDREKDTQMPHNEVYVWGNNSNGQLGLSEQTPIHAVDLPKLCNFNTIITKVACGSNHSIMLSQNGHLFSMGSNKFGQLGLDLPFTEGDINVRKPLRLQAGLKDVTIGDVVSGSEHCLAMTADGRQLFAWGQGKYGALGNFRSQNVNRPQIIPL